MGGLNRALCHPEVAKLVANNSCSVSAAPNKLRVASGAEEQSEAGEAALRKRT